MRPISAPDPSLSPSADSRIAAVCQRFEAAWQEGQRPRLEDFLEPGIALEQPTLLRELLRLDIRYREREGELPSHEEYRARFPHVVELIDELVAETTKNGRTPDQQSGLPPPSSDQTTSPSRRDVEELPTDEFPLPPLGPHELRGEIGSGGMGVVFLACDLLLNRVVALKMLRGCVLATPGGVQRFSREARAAARVRHPHLLPVIAIGLFQGQPCFTMPYLPGDTLASRLKSPWTPREAVVLLEKVARGVGAAHAEGIVHRDLKPGNILFDEQDEPLVADFGLAKFFSEQNVEVTLPGQVMGTPAYMSPEQASGANDRVGPASDVWSLGVILYTLLTGQRPFSGENREEVTDRIRNQSPVRPRLLRRTVPKELESVVLVCLDKEPTRRYPTSRDLAEDLGRWLRGEPVRARPSGWLRRHLRNISLVSAGLLLAGLLIVAVWLARTDRRPEPIERIGPIDLVGDNGLTREPAVLVGKAEVTTTSPGVVRVQAGKLTLLQLFAHAPFPRFRFRGEVLDEGKNTTAVGLYVAQKSIGNANGFQHWFIPLHFSEQRVMPASAPGKPNRARMALELYRFVPPAPGKPGAGDRYQHLFGQQPLAENRLGWRSICLDVTSETIQGRPGADKAAVARIVRGREWRQTVQMLGSLPLLIPSTPPELSWQGGLGLFCHNGTASFRRLVVGPLAADE